jgi:dienelactone hydrolase
MTNVLLFHHVLGVTDGIRWFADELRAEGHEVTVADLWEGATFPSIQEGVAHAQEVGFGNVIEQGTALAADLPDGSVVIGFSLGALPAQNVAQNRPGVRGAVLLYSALPSAEFGGPWPDGVAVQIHIAEHDENLEEGELDGAKALAAEAADGEIHLYPGTAHLIAEKGFADYDPESAALILGRTKEFLARMGNTDPRA